MSFVNMDLGGLHEWQYIPGTNKWDLQEYCRLFTGLSYYFFPNKIWKSIEILEPHLQTKFEILPRPHVNRETKAQIGKEMFIRISAAHFTPKMNSRLKWTLKYFVLRILNDGTGLCHQWAHNHSK